MTTHKRFPPGRGHVLLPTSSRRAARAGLSLYAACKPRVLRAQQVADALVATVGPRWLPGQAAPLQLPVDGEVHDALLEELERDLGAFDELAVYQRSQTTRGGFALLPLRHGRPIAFVKVRTRRAGRSFDTEVDAMRAVRASAVAFAVPTVLATGRVAHLDWMASTSLPGRVHRPPKSVDIDAVTKDIQRGLASWPRPAGVAAHWRPMHGDFAPWNLRQGRDGTLTLIDWDDVGWGPPGADAVFYWALARAMGHRATVSDDALLPEAAAYWHDRVRRRPVEGRDPKLWAEVYAAWRGLAEGSAP